MMDLTNRRLPNVVEINGSLYSIYTDLYSISKLEAILTSWGGKIGVVLFVLISGYFLENSKFKIINSRFVFANSMGATNCFTYVNSLN